MPREFWRATAEAVVAAVDAAYVSIEPVDADYVAAFTQLTVDNAKAALALAADLGLLRESGGTFSQASPLCRALVTANQQRKATALRLALEDYGPFVRFRERLMATGDATIAAQQTKQLLDLSNHHDEVKETLLSLGQYSQALVAEGGGVYKSREDAAVDELTSLAEGCASDAAAEQLVRVQLGPRALEKVSRDEVVVPLANAVQKAKVKDGRGAVVSAGNAVESYLSGLGARCGVLLAGKNGINAKAEELSAKGKLPKKLLNVARYLGHVRNAADHGVDAEIGTSWSIRDATGVEYCFVACSFIAAVTERENGGAAEI